MSTPEYKIVVLGAGGVVISSGPSRATPSPSHFPGRVDKTQFQGVESMAFIISSIEGSMAL